MYCMSKLFEISFLDGITSTDCVDVVALYYTWPVCKLGCAKTAEPIISWCGANSWCVGTSYHRLSHHGGPDLQQEGSKGNF